LREGEGVRRRAGAHRSRRRNGTLRRNSSRDRDCHRVRGQHGNCGAGDAAEITAGAIVLVLLCVMGTRHLVLHGAVAAACGHGVPHRLRMRHLGNRCEEQCHRRESGEAAAKRQRQAKHHATKVAE
jgi:hypothetical protein